MAHIHDEHMSLAKNMEIMQNITDLLNSTFPNTSVYASLGNHDFFPSAQASPELDQMYEQTAEMWRHWSGDAQADQFKHGQ